MKSKNLLSALTILFLIGICHVTKCSESKSHKSGNKSNSKGKSKSKNSNKKGVNNTNATFKQSNFSSYYLKNKMGLSSKQFGFTGQCLYQQNKIETTSMPTAALSITNGIVLPVLRAIGGTPNVCIGDFTGDSLLNKTELRNMSCDYLPLSPSINFGTAAFTAYNVPCAGGKINLCSVFNNSGTGALVLDGGILNCGVSLSGVGNILRPFLKMIDAVGIGFSVNRDFQRNFNLCWSNSSQTGIDCGTKTHKANFFFLVNIGMPEIKIGKFDLSSIISFNGTPFFTLDLGPLINNASSYINSMTNCAKCSDGANLLESLRNLGAEFAITLDGSFTINFNQLTNGLIPDMTLNLNKKTLLMTKGGGSSGLRSGIYFNIQSNIIGDFLNILLDFFNNFLSLFSKWGIPMPDLSFGSVAINSFVDSFSAGFKINIVIGELLCIIRFSDGRVGCKYNDKIWTFIKRAIMYVILEVGSFFSDVGVEIGRIGTKIGNFAEKVGNSIANFSEETWRNTERVAKQTINTIKRGVEDATRKTGKFFTNVAKNVQDGFNKLKNDTERFFNDAAKHIVNFVDEAQEALFEAADEVKEFFEDAGKGIADFFKNTGNSIKKFFKKW